MVWTQFSIFIPTTRPDPPTYLVKPDGTFATIENEVTAKQEAEKFLLDLYTAIIYNKNTQYIMTLKLRFQFPRDEFTGPNIIFHDEFTHEIRKWTHSKNIENHLLKLEYNSDTNTTVVTFPSDKAVLLFVMTWTSTHTWCTNYKVLQD